MERAKHSGLTKTVVILSLAILGTMGVGDRLAGQWAYAIERGKLQATSEELAAAQDEIADAQQLSKAFRMVAKVARPGVVHIRVAGRDGSEVTEEEILEEADKIKRFHPGLSDETLLEIAKRRLLDPPASGSGIIFEADGHILTNNHVVESRRSITVRLHDERTFDAKVVGTDPKTDLAVIKIDAPGLHPLKFGNSDDMEVGDWVLAVGAPFGLSHSVTHGIISAKGRTEVPTAGILYQDFIQTDAAINPGNSGGPLLNLKGEVIGVNTAIATNGEDHSNAGIAFTIPSKMAAKIANELKTSGTVARGWLGVKLADITATDAEILGLKASQGVLVDTILDDQSPALKAGLLVDDAILAVNGTDVNSIRQLRDLIADIKPGQPAKFRVARDRKERELTVELGRQPDEFGGVSPAALAGRFVDALGLSVRSLRPGLPQAFGDLRLAAMAAQHMMRAENVRGLFVVNEQGASTSAVAGVLPGELVVECNGRAVSTVSDLTRAMELRSTRGPIELKVIGHDGEPRVVTVKQK